MSDTVERELKEAMGYRGPNNCCKKCVYFVPTDCSGNHNAKNAHCKLNPAINLPVEEGGWCTFMR